MKKIAAILLIAIVTMAIPAGAATLRWDPSTGTVEGYGVYYWQADQTAPANLAEAKTLAYVGNVHSLDDASLGAEVTADIMAAHPQWTEDVLGARMYDLSRLTLTPGADYQFAVTAYNSAGESEPCAPVSYTVPGYAPPEARLLENDLAIPAGSTIIVIQP